MEYVSRLSLVITVRKKRGTPFFQSEAVTKSKRGSTAEGRERNEPTKSGRHRKSQGCSIGQSLFEACVSVQHGNELADSSGHEDELAEMNSRDHGSLLSVWPKNIAKF